MLAERTLQLRRRDVVRALLADRGDLLVVSGLGSPSWDVAAAGDHSLNFYLLGAMGNAAALGLGLALAQPQHRVLVITGDGELLMGLGTLATIAVRAPANLAIAVVDNEAYGETGNQQTHTAFGVDLAAVAKAVGFAATAVAHDDAGLERVIALVRSPATGPVLGVVKIAAEKPPLVLPPLDAAYVKARFRAALLGSPL